MNSLTRAAALGVVISAFPAWATAQKQMSAKETAPKKQTSSPREFGNSYVTLRPEQKKLVDDYVSHYNQTAGSKIAPQTAYDGARLSVRTTFDAVTHALLDAKMTEVTLKSLGRAIDLVDAVDEIMGEEAGVGATGSFVSTSMSSEPPSTPWPAVKSFCANTTTLFITRVFRSAFA
jgi:hypothetical protein